MPICRLTHPIGPKCIKFWCSQVNQANLKITILFSVITGVFTFVCIEFLLCIQVFVLLIRENTLLVNCQEVMLLLRGDNILDRMPLDRILNSGLRHDVSLSVCLPMQGATREFWMPSSVTGQQRTSTSTYPSSTISAVWQSTLMRQHSSSEFHFCLEAYEGGRRSGEAGEVLLLWPVVFWNCKCVSRHCTQTEITWRLDHAVTSGYQQGINPQTPLPHPTQPRPTQPRPVASEAKLEYPSWTLPADGKLLK